MGAADMTTFHNRLSQAGMAGSVIKHVAHFKHPVMPDLPVATDGSSLPLLDVLLHCGFGNLLFARRKCHQLLERRRQAAGDLL